MLKIENGMGCSLINGNEKIPVFIEDIEFNPNRVGPIIRGVLLTDLSEKIDANKVDIKDVIFNDPATIVIWEDGTKTVVKCQPGDVYDREKGLALCIAKKCMGNKGSFNDVFKKYIKDD